MVLFGSYEDDEIDGDGITFHAKDFPFILLIGIIGGLVWKLLYVSLSDSLYSFFVSYK